MPAPPRLARPVRRPAGRPVRRSFRDLSSHAHPTPHAGLPRLVLCPGNPLDASVLRLPRLPPTPLSGALRPHRLAARDRRQGRVRLTFAPRIDFGSLETRLHVSAAGLAIEGLIDPCVLLAPGIQWTILQQGPHQTAVAEVDVGPSPLVLELRYGTASLAPARLPEPQRRDQTQKFWSQWAATLNLPSLRTDLVLRMPWSSAPCATAPPARSSPPPPPPVCPNAPAACQLGLPLLLATRTLALSAAPSSRLRAPGPALKFLDPG